MKSRADLLLQADQGSVEARELYRKLLEHFPEYPFTAEVRQRLRGLGIG